MTSDSDSKPSDDGAHPGRAPRQSVFLSAILEHFGSNQTTKHRVRDLSAGGMRIDQAADLHVGATVLATVGMLQAIGATIVWVKDGWAGIKFAVDVDPDQARGKAAVVPKTIAASRRWAPDVVPTAGWIGDLNNPYRK